MKETLLKNAELLHAATVSDDKQTFLKILNDCPELYGAVFGRFPLESLAVMYSARKILSAAEFPSAPKLAFREYPEDYIEFKKIAGRALRLYAGGKEVAPDEMRIMVGEETVLRSDGKQEKAYELSHGKTLKTSKSGAIVPPKSRAVTGVRRKILNAVIIFTAVFLIASAALTAVSVSVTGDGSKLAPVRADSSDVLLNALDGSDRYIKIENDLSVALSEDPEFGYTGVLDGGGHILTVTGGFYGDPFGILSGATVKNLTVKYDGFRAEYAGNKRTIVLERDFTLKLSELSELSAPVLQSDLFGNGHTLTITDIARDGVFSGATFDQINGNISGLNIVFDDAEFDYSGTTGLLARVNNATISEVTFSFSGKIHETNTRSDTYFGLLVGENRGTVSNITATFDVTGDSDFDGQAEDNNSYFGGIIGLNYGRVINCVTTADSVAETVTLDVAGLVGENALGGEITGSINRAAMITTTAVKEWSPNAAGVAVANRGDIDNCYNYGALTANSSVVHDEPDSDTEDVERSSTLIGGITATNYGIVSHSYNGGDLSSSTAGAIPNIGGIVGNDTAGADRNTIIRECISDCTINFDITAAAPLVRYYSIGGIVSTVAPQSGKSATVTGCYSLTRFNGDTITCGGIIGAVTHENGAVNIGNVGSAEENLYLEDVGALSAVGLINRMPASFAGAANEITITDREGFWYVAEE